VIFHDATLREIATVWPTSVGELGGISGVGEKKLTTYGEGVLEVLASLGGPSDSAPAGTSASAADSPSAQAPGPSPVSGQAPASGLSQASGQAPASAQAPAPAVGQDAGEPYHWPEMDAEPEPDDWI
jgi:ATP-dependent DNA helicase RecQ